MIMHETLHRRFTFDNQPAGKVVPRIQQGERPEITVKCSQLLKELIQRCWDQNPKNRPTFAEIVARLEPTNEEDPA
jgi:hypothetical protein